MHETNPIPEPGVEVWGLQYTWQSHRLDRAFVMDEEEWILNKNKSIGRDIVKEINELNIPIYVSKPWADLTHWIEYPLNDVLDYFKNIRHRVLKKTERGEEWDEIQGKYFLNSFAYMLAMAITQMPDRIELFGIDMANLNGRLSKDEGWEDEKNCVNFWVGVAVGRGIEVVISKDSRITKPTSPDAPTLYGYEVAGHLEKIRTKFLEDNKVLKNAISSGDKIIDLTKSDIKLHVFRKEDVPDAKPGDVVVPKAEPYGELGN